MSMESGDNVFEEYKPDILQAEEDVMWTMGQYDPADEEAFATGARMSLLRLAGFPSGQLDTKKVTFNKRATIESLDSEAHYRVTYDGTFMGLPLNFGMHEVKFEPHQTVITRRKFAISALNGSTFKYIHRMRTKKVVPGDERSVDALRLDAGLPTQSDPWYLQHFPDADIDNLVTAHLRTQTQRAQLLHKARGDLLPILRDLNLKLRSNPRLFTNANNPPAEDGPTFS